MPAVDAPEFVGAVQECMCEMFYIFLRTRLFESIIRVDYSSDTIEKLQLSEVNSYKCLKRSAP
jgi:hypothetical protein